MKAALAYELMRIRTIRSTWWLTGLAIGLGVLVTGLISWGLSVDHGEAESDLGVMGSLLVTQLSATGEVPSIVCFLVAIIGILAWGHEYRHGMVRASLTTVSSRVAFATAKYLVVSVWVAVTVLVACLLSGLLAQLVLGDWLTIWNSQTWSIVFRQVLFAVLLTLVGAGFTAVTRSQVAALVLLFIWPLVIETLVHLIFAIVPSLRDSQDALRFLPFDAGRNIVDVLGSSSSVFGDPLSVLGGGIVFGGLAAVLVGTSYVLFLRRDA